MRSNRYCTGCSLFKWNKYCYFFHQRGYTHLLSGRPISLLNVNFKIISNTGWKIEKLYQRLTERLKNAWNCTFRSEGLYKWLIYWRKYLFSWEYSWISHDESIILLLDPKKTFDRVECNTMFWNNLILLRDS